MTSMPLTTSNGFAGSGFGIAAMCLRPVARLPLLRAVARGDLLLRRVGLGGGLDQRPQELGVRFQPVGGVAPVLAVLRVDAPLAHAFMVVARRLDGLHD